MTLSRKTVLRLLAGFVLLTSISGAVCPPRAEAVEAVKRNPKVLAGLGVAATALAFVGVLYAAFGGDGTPNECGVSRLHNVC